MRQDMLDAMERIFREESVAVQWRAGDVMLINNLQVMHARETFVDGEAPRRVLASLGRDPAPVMEERLANSLGEQHGVGSNKQGRKYAWQATGGDRRTHGPPALRESKTRAKVIRGNPHQRFQSRSSRQSRREGPPRGGVAQGLCRSPGRALREMMRLMVGGDDGWVSGETRVSHDVHDADGSKRVKAHRAGFPMII